MSRVRELRDFSVMKLMDGLTVLVEAKKEYMAQLCSVLCPQMIETFELMYTEAHKMSKGREVLKQFQKLLKEVPNWNNTMIEDHNTKLNNTCGWFNDLMAAVFVSYVKILSSVRLNSTDKKISVKLPTNDVFIHGCYKAVAKDLYRDPFVYHDEMSEYQRDEILTRRYVVCIEETVKKLLPVQEILKLYITQTDKVDIDHEEPEPEPEPEEEIPAEGEGEPTAEGTEEAPLPPGTEIPAPPPDTSKDPMPSLAPISSSDAENVKNIHVDGKGAEDDVLFPDARD
jgi:hypothetical protein